MASLPAIQLYRSPEHPQHWVAWSERHGWLVFPARFDGWRGRQPYPGVNQTRLQPVPLWLGFGTGLLEAVIARAA